MRAVLYDGAADAVRAQTAELAFFHWAAERFAGGSFALCGGSVEALRRDLLRVVLPQLRAEGFACSGARAGRWLTVRRDGAENRFYLLGAARERAEPCRTEEKLSGALILGVTDLPRPAVERVCGQCGGDAVLWFTAVPAGPQHWFYRTWIERAAERRMLRVPLPAPRDVLADTPQDSCCGVLYRRRVLGEWVSAEGRVYDGYDLERDAAECPDGPWERYRAAVDYGTVNPTSIGLWAQKAGVWYRVDECYYDSRVTGRQRTDEEHADALRALTAGRTVERVIVDPSAASLMETLRRRGFRVVRADNAVLRGLEVTGRLLRQRKLVICRGCVNCLREIAAYHWGGSRGRRDLPCKADDHAMDELRYFAMDVAREEEGADGARSQTCTLERKGNEMNEQDISVRLTENDERLHACTRRLEAVEHRQDSLDKLVTAVEVLAVRQESVEGNVREMRAAVQSLAEKPAKRWEMLGDRVLYLLVGAAFSLLAQGVGA